MLQAQFSFNNCNFYSQNTENILITLNNLIDRSFSNIKTGILGHAPFISTQLTIVHPEFSTPVYLIENVFNIQTHFDLSIKSLPQESNQKVPKIFRLLLRFCYICMSCTVLHKRYSNQPKMRKTCAYMLTRYVCYKHWIYLIWMNLFMSFQKQMLLLN